MSSLFERSVTPYMMNPIEFIGTSEKYINKEKLIKCLDRVNSGPIGELRNVLSSSDIADIPWVEQESLKIKAVR